MLILFIVAALIFFSFGKTRGEAATCQYPAEILDLTNWKQTLPTGSKKKPEEIKQSRLATFLSQPYFGLNSDCTGVVFRAPVNGVTTSGSGYPRSELREMENSGKELASWSTTSGTHTMIIDQAITAVPKKKKHVVAGQIHDKEDDVIVIRLEYPKLFVDINGKDGPILDANYTLGKRFTIKFVASDGKIRVYYNGHDNPVHTLSKKSSGNYFKAGAYTQSNCSKESDCSSSNFGEVVIYNLFVQHGSGTLKTAASPTLDPAPETDDFESLATEDQGSREQTVERVEEVSTTQTLWCPVYHRENAYFSRWLTAFRESRIFSHR